MMFLHYQGQFSGSKKKLKGVEQLMKGQRFVATKKNYQVSQLQDLVFICIFIKSGYSS